MRWRRAEAIARAWSAPIWPSRQASAQRGRWRSVRPRRTRRGRRCGDPAARGDPRRRRLGPVGRPLLARLEGGGRLGDEGLEAGELVVEHLDGRAVAVVLGATRAPARSSASAKSSNSTGRCKHAGVTHRRTSQPRFRRRHFGCRHRGTGATVLRVWSHCAGAAGPIPAEPARWAAKESAIRERRRRSGRPGRRQRDRAGQAPAERVLDVGQRERASPGRRRSGRPGRPPPAAGRRRSPTGRRRWCRACAARRPRAGRRRCSAASRGAPARRPRGAGSPRPT